MLPKKVLLAYDGTTPSRKAAEYLGQVFGHRRDFEITVCVIARKPPSYLLQSGGGRSFLEREELFEKAVSENLAQARRVAERGRELLAVFPKEKVDLRVCLQTGDLAYEIIREAESGRYDAIVVGRRGLSRTTQGFMGSVSYKLAEHAPCPVWMVAGKAWNHKVLVPVDLGGPGFRVVDHVSFIFAGDPQVEITLFHAVYPWTGPGPRTKTLKEMERELVKAEEEEAQAFFERAREHFEKSGFPSERVRVKIVRSLFGPASAILKEARRGGYGTVVVGRRGRGGFKGLLLGSVSSKIIATLKDRAVWLVS
ncbi:hypothetical protein FVE67_08225 [Thermosulfurimonas marina]|uniref:UspA domain-containing protein n=1 Tax=Thermosulfurimonas marina TaxID=2047767 RepID=A0A6H1WU77_9BACT|nr:universal stress protein [Thermosulfurimonas marina]QJA06775.1 hypothetical protein FVE67_08225 [Thermosulfurimonas marina]